MALEIPYPENDILFISDDVYRWQILDEIGACAFYAGKPHVGYHACKRLLDENLVPADHRPRIVENFKQYEKIVMQIQTEQAQQEAHNKMQEEEEKKQLKIEKRNTPKKGTKVNQVKRGKTRSKAKR